MFLGGYPLLNDEQLEALEVVFHDQLIECLHLLWIEPTCPSHIDFASILLEEPVDPVVAHYLMCQIVNQGVQFYMRLSGFAFIYLAQLTPIPLLCNGCTVPLSYNSGWIVQGQVQGDEVKG